ncbi:ribonuclease R [bacterium]|nr:ribonuclease R [bacterium]
MKDNILKLLNVKPNHAFHIQEILKVLKIKPVYKKDVKNLLKRLAGDGKIIKVAPKIYQALSNDNRLIGTLKMHYDGFGFLIPEKSGEQDVFIPAKYMAGALSQDKVAVVWEEDPKGRSGRVVEILERGRKTWVGILGREGKHYVVTNRDFNDELKIVVDAEGISHDDLGNLVLVEVTSYPSAHHSIMKGKVLRIIGNAKSDKALIEAVLAKHNLSPDFPDAVRHETEKTPKKITKKDLAGRVDLTKLPIITIDGLHARDFDDAVCVLKEKGGYRLYVSIADVAHYVKPKTALDAEALSRGNSTYFANRVIPMLPEELSNEMCSLKPYEIRLTLTSELFYDTEGTLKSARYYESFIKSAKRGIYENIQAFFDRGETPSDHYDKEVRESLINMKHLAQALMQKRKKRGTLDFELPEAQVVFSPEGDVETIAVAERFFANQLIEEFMIAANVAVAELFCALKVPALYRVHDEPNPEKLYAYLQTLHLLGFKTDRHKLKEPGDFKPVMEKLKGHPMEEFLHFMFLRSLKQAQYSEETLGHFGLNLRHYSHFTSPIRRYPDLIVHRLLKDLVQRADKGIIEAEFTVKNKKVGVKVKTKIKKEKILYSPEFLARVGQATSKTERNSMEAEREILDLNRLFFIRNHVNEVFHGRIRRIVKFGLFIELTPHFVEGLVHVKDLNDDYYIFDEGRIEMFGRRRKKKYKIGDKVKVRVVGYSLEKRSIELALE